MRSHFMIKTLKIRARIVPFTAFLLCLALFMTILPLTGVADTEKNVVRVGWYVWKKVRIEININHGSFVTFFSKIYIQL